jgi:hypothetical protein
MLISKTRPSWLCLLLLPIVLALGCSSWPFGSSEENSPVAIAGRAAKTIVILPLNIVLELPTELDSSTDMVSGILVEQLEKDGKTVHQLDFRVARALWIQAARSVKESNRANNFENAAEVLTRLVGEKMEFDALIIPSLFLQNAKLKQPKAGLTAHWDGASQLIEWVGTPTAKTKDPKLRGVGGASILLYIFDRNGEQLAERRTGLELIQHLAIESKRRQGQDEKTWVLENDAPAIADRERVEAAIAHALNPFVPKN